MAKPFLIAQVSDLHIKAAGKLSYRIVDTAGMLRACIAHMLAQPQLPDVVVFTGDLVDFGRPEEYAVLRDLLGPLDMPVYLIPGNHDERGALRRAFSDHAYLRQAIEFVNYAIEDHPVRIIALDTTVPGESGGLVCAERLAWLDAKLAEQPKKATVVLMHHPPFHTFIGHMDVQGLERSDALADVIRQASAGGAPAVRPPASPDPGRASPARLHARCPAPRTRSRSTSADDAPSRFVMEPPAYGLHAFTPETGIISHTAFVGSFAGPYPFYENGRLID